MAAAADESTSNASSSLELLQVRLRRLEFLLNGTSTSDGIPEHASKPQDTENSVLRRLNTTQDEFARLKRDDGVLGEMIRDLETLYARCPELRKDQPSIPLNDLSTPASIVLANASLYPETASRLSSLQTLPIPPVESSTGLEDLLGTIEQCRKEQDELDMEVQQLRQRSARCLEWWVKNGVVGMGDLWEEWEDRMIEMQRQLGRFERQQKDQEGYM